MTLNEKISIEEVIDETIDYDEWEVVPEAKHRPGNCAEDCGCPLPAESD